MYILGYLALVVVPCSRTFGIPAPCPLFNANRWSQALAAGLEQNRGLRGFHLSKMDSSLWHGCCPNDAIGHQGSQALDEAEKKKKKRGDNFVMYWNSDQSHRLKTVHNS